ncbi:hypothetical protein [Hymenobacter pini]|uniref:hypothetical protein n=1 Tax=Hymenobacter pini TaxID=2880879 RepID=UPI001CF18BF5|nr:hypothetical protein [Hymenobacter pini]
MRDFRNSETDPSLHDAVVDQFLFHPGRARLQVVIWKNDDRRISWWQLIISGISNGSKVQWIQDSVNAALAKASRHSLGFRIDEFKCVKQSSSQQGCAMAVTLSIDHLPSIRIECGKCDIQRLDYPPLNFKC